MRVGTQSLTSSRDGCSVSVAADAIVSELTMALDDVGEGVVGPSIAALSNMLRLDLGVEEALGAGIVAKLAKLVARPARREAARDEPAGAVEPREHARRQVGCDRGGLLDVLAEQLRAATNIRRLAAGCVMAITIDKGKYASLPCVDPLCELLFDLVPTRRTRRCRRARISPSTQKPGRRSTRGAKEGRGRRDGADVRRADLRPQAVAGVAPPAQNIAPGGMAAADEAATRER